ncbi:MAG: hypothetical protein R2697_00505 [Ilumatobacteraceae bacterium]
MPFVELRSAILKPLPDRVMRLWWQLTLLSETTTVQSKEATDRVGVVDEADAVARWHHDRAGTVTEVRLLELRRDPESAGLSELSMRSSTLTLMKW